MKQHQFFNLQLLTNEEIEDILGLLVTERVTLSQWPLSCVEKVICADGTSWIVKSNHEPCDIEGQFYTKVNHPYVIKPVYTQSTPPYQTILYRYIEGIPYSVVNLNNKHDTEKCFREDFSPILTSISQPNLPVYLKIDTREYFLNTFSNLITRLSHLVETGKFDRIQKKTITSLAKIIESNLTVEIGTSNTSLVHGDFNVNNILQNHQNNKLIILDWQRPIYGSPLIDEYSFVKSNDFQPDPQAVLIGSLVQIYWLVDCAINWFPEGCSTYNIQTGELLSALFSAYQALNTNQIKM
jgi:hypothetical protein